MPSPLFKIQAYLCMRNLFWVIILYHISLGIHCLVGFIRLSPTFRISFAGDKSTFFSQNDKLRKTLDIILISISKIKMDTAILAATTQAAYVL